MQPNEMEVVVSRFVFMCAFFILLFACEKKEQDPQLADDTRAHVAVPPGKIEWTNSKGEVHYTTEGQVPQKKQFEEVETVPQSASRTVFQPSTPLQPPELPTIKAKPTWDTRGLTNWNKAVCDSQGRCTPNGYATMLVEFTHLGCRPFKQAIDDRSAHIYGYDPKHQFILVIAATDALTRELFDYVKPRELPCRVFLYDDTLKPDKTPPNEDQLFVEMCKDATSVADGECRSQLGDKRLYVP